MAFRGFFIWSLALFLALSGGMILMPIDARVSTLETGLGPLVETRPL